MWEEGHSEIGLIGSGILQERLGYKTPHAFTMGNWLTDVRQGVDPVAYEEVRNKLEDLKDVFDKIIDEATSYLPEVITEKKRVQREIKDIKVFFYNKLDFVSSVLKEGKKSKAAGAISDLFKVKGYFKFVQPGNISEEVFLSIFENQFTQYYPHDHLDRPHIIGGKKNIIEVEKNKKTNSYQYLDDQIKAVSVILAETDDYLINHKEYIKNADDATLKKDTKLNRILARLGYALHTIEDFFAHSIFVDQAMDALNQTPKDFQQQFSKIHLKRLKATDQDKKDDPDWATPGNSETSIVTGYFDSLDTLISMAKMAEHRAKMPSKGHEHDIGTLLTFIDNPEQFAVNQKDQLVTELHKTWAEKCDQTNSRTPKNIAKLVDTAIKYFGDDLPQWVKDSLHSATNTLSSTELIPGYAISLYAAYKTIIDFILD